MTTAVGRARHPVGAGRGGSALRGLGGDGRVVRRRGTNNPLPGVFYVLMWVGLVAAVAGGRAGLASDLAGAHGVPAAAAAGLPAGRGYPGRLGLLARGVRPVRVRLAGARQPRPGIARRDQALAVGLYRRHPDRRDRLRRPVVRPRRPVRGVQRRRIAVLAVASQPAERPHRDRQPVRPPAVAADPAGHCRRCSRCCSGSTAFDSFSAMPVWRNFVDRHADSAADRDAACAPRGCWSSSPLWSATFWLAARGTGGVDRRDHGASCPG